MTTDVRPVGDTTSEAAAAGARAAALCRIVVATSLLLVLRGLEQVPARIAAWPAADHQPVGLARLLPEPVWTSTTVTTLVVAAAVAAALALVGLWARSTFALAFTLTLLVVSAQYSWTLAWSHGENLTFLCGLPLLLVRTGDAWSVDAARGRVSPQVGHWYGAGVLAAQTMVALYFLGAAWFKLSRSGLDWALSDNLQRILALRYHVLGVTPTPLADLALSSAPLARAFALGNLLAQALPALLLPFLRHRWARLTAAALVTAEAVGLTLVMGLFHGEMLPLGVVFLAVAPRRVRLASARARVAVVALVGLVCTQAVVGFAASDVRLRAYPFTAAAMFSTRLGDEIGRLVIRTDPELPPGEDRRIQEEDTLPVGADECRLLRRLDHLAAEAAAVHDIRIRQLTVEHRTWRIVGGEASVVATSPVLTATPDAVRQRRSADCSPAHEASG